MNNWLNMYTFIAFIIGILASTMVKSAFSSAKSKVA